MSDWNEWGRERLLWQQRQDWINAWEGALQTHDHQALDDLYAEMFPETTQKTLTWIMDVHVGPGGKEAQDLKNTLVKMYLRWAEAWGVSTEMVDHDEQGTVLRLEGEKADLFLTQQGVHRFIRVSPFDKNKRVHTSFVGVSVAEEIEPPTEQELHSKDVEVSVMKSSGAGGQHVNKTESAVRMKHLPTGLTVVCRNSRSQHTNKKAAWSLLQKKVADFYLPSQEHENQPSGWGMKTHTYHLPNNTVTYHNLKVSFSQVEDYLQGRTMLPQEIIRNAETRAA